MEEFFPRSIKDLFGNNMKEAENAFGKIPVTFVLEKEGGIPTLVRKAMVNNPVSGVLGKLSAEGLFSWRNGENREYVETDEELRDGETYIIDTADAKTTAKALLSL